MSELERLRSQVATLEEMLTVQEHVTVQQTRKLEETNSELEASERAKSELVDRLRLAVDELSTPILEVWEDVLALPIIGLVDSHRAAQIMERLLEEVVERQTSDVIIDVTGVEIIDSKTAEHFTKIVRAVELMGATCLLTGIRPAVGQALVDLGLEFADVGTFRTLKHALRAAIRQAGPSAGTPAAAGRVNIGAR